MLKLTYPNYNSNWYMLLNYLYNNKSGKVFTFNLTEVDPTTAPPKKYLD